MTPSGAAAPRSPARTGPPAPARWAWGLLALVIVLWGTHYAVLKVGTTALGPSVFTAWRLTVTAAVLWPLAVRWGGPRPQGRTAWQLLGLGLLGSGLYQVLLMIGVAHTASLTAGLVSAAGPAVVIALAVAARTMTATVRLWGGLALAALATALMSLPGAAGGPSGTVGVLALVGSLVAWGLWSLAIVRLIGTVHPLWLTAFPLLIGAPLLWAVALLSDGAAALQWPTAAWGPLLWSGVIATPFTRWGWTVVVQQLGLGRATIWTHLETPVAVATSVLWLGDRFHWLHAVSALALGGALWLLEQRPVPGTPQPPEPADP